ncbi:MAG: hypothetical protein JXX28_05045 [Deltaproteobacteria bacterium]|nr:hypothetical protein [Deltaproteobacteria bacterium]
MADMLTFLQLAEEFGGTKFGPFTAAEIRLGSDPENNDIVLPENLGVLPQHMKVLLQKDGSFILAPVERTATVFLWKPDGRPPKQLNTPSAAVMEDSFSLVTAEGVRFQLLREEEKREKPTDRGKTGLAAAKGRLSIGGMIAEVKRQGLSRVMRTTVGHMWQTGYKFVASGAILKPRNIIMMVMVVSGWIFAGGVGCTALSLASQKADVKDDLKECNGDLAALGALSTEDPTIGSLTQEILGDLEWLNTLQSDAELNQAYVKELKSVFQRRDQFEWVYKNRASDFVDFSTAITGKVNNEPLVRVLSYVAAPPGRKKERDWQLLRQDSLGNRTCGRGMTSITFRQARNLELSTKLDALVQTQIATSGDLEPKKRALQETGQLAGMSIEDLNFTESEIQAAGVGAQGGYQCIFVDGDDDRADMSALAKGLAKAIGPEAKGLPKAGGDHWIAARLTKYYASDYDIEFDQLNFKAGTPNQILSAIPNDPRSPWVMQQTAETIARAVGVPCLARLYGNKDKPPEHLPGELPSLMKCGLLNLLADDSSFGSGE